MRSNLIDEGGREWGDTQGRIWHSRGRCDCCAGKRFPHQHMLSTLYYCMNHDCRRSIVHPACSSPDAYYGPVA